MLFVDLFGVEVYSCFEALPPGMNGSSKEKFAVGQQKGIFQQLLDDFESGKIPRGSWEQGEIELLSLQTVIINRFWHEAIWNVLFPSKDKKSSVQGTYRWIEWNVGMDSGAAVLAFTKKQELILTQNYRHASRAWRTEIPRGILKKGETPTQCGLRESLEEGGIILSDRGEIVDLGRIEPDSGLARMTPTIILMTEVEVDLTKVRHDVSECIQGTICLPIERVQEEVVNGNIIDGYLLSGLSKKTMLGY